MRQKFGREWLVDFIESAITSRRFGNDEATYAAWEIILDKLKKSIGLSSMEKEMVKEYLYDVAYNGVPDFSKVQRDKADHIAASLDRWA